MLKSNNAGICEGDSGAPVLLGGKAVGVVIATQGCAAGKYGVMAHW